MIPCSSGQWSSSIAIGFILDIFNYAGISFSLVTICKDRYFNQERRRYLLFLLHELKSMASMSSVVSNMSRGRIKNLKVIVLADPIKLVGSSPIGAAMKMYDTVPFSISLSL